MKSYYYLIGKNTNGPFSLEELKTKKLTIETYIWFDNLNDWEKLRSHPKLCQELNVISVPPPLPSEIENIAAEKVSIPLGNRGIVKSGKKVIKFIFLAFLFLLFIIGFVLIKVSAKMHDDRVAWYIGMPLLLIAVFSLNYFRKKWGEKKEETKNENETSKDNTLLKTIFISFVVIILIFLLLKLLPAPH